MVTVGLSNHGSFLFPSFFKGSAYIVGKHVMHPCVPFRSGAPLILFGVPLCTPCTPVEEQCNRWLLIMLLQNKS